MAVDSDTTEVKARAAILKVTVLCDMLASSLKKVYNPFEHEIPIFTLGDLHPRNVGSLVPQVPVFGHPPHHPSNVVEL
jgi:hypothetical protein